MWNARMKNVQSMTRGKKTSIKWLERDRQPKYSCRECGTVNTPEPKTSGILPKRACSPFVCTWKTTSIVDRDTRCVLSWVVMLERTTQDLQAWNVLPTPNTIIRMSFQSTTPCVMAPICGCVRISMELFRWKLSTLTCDITSNNWYASLGALLEGCNPWSKTSNSLFTVTTIASLQNVVSQSAPST